jgi:hypothetical protein
MLKKPLLIVTLAVGACAGVAGTLLMPPVAHAEAAKVSKKVGEPLAAALDAAKKGQFSQALAKLKQADAVAGKTAFEQFQINETYGFVYLKQRNYPAAAAAYERSLNSGQLPAGQVNDRVKQIAQLYFPKDLNKTIEYTNRWLKTTGSKDPAMYAMLGQAYQLSGNDKAAIAATQTAVRNAQAAGQRPSENWLRVLLKSYGALGDAEGVNKTTNTLVTLYPTKDNWRLLASELRKQAAGDDRVALNVYGLMLALDLMDKPDTYTEAAIVAIQAGLPGYATTIMDQGYAAKIFTAKEEARAQRINNDARTKAAAQKQSLPKLEQAAAGAKQGQADLQLAQILLSYDQADKAIAAARTALKKGGLANPDDAYMLIGRAYLQLKNSAEARKAFAQVKGGELDSLARLWGIYAASV